MKSRILTLLITISCMLSTYAQTQSKEICRLGKTPIVLAYITSQDGIMPDPNYVTHINYAFGKVNDTFDGIVIDNEKRLKQISALKKQYPHLKVMLSIGGWTSGRFSEMAGVEETREAFAADCKRVVDQFDLDGIDMDWEYPTSSEASISSSPDDLDNFTQLMKDIRKNIGDDKLLTFASAYTALYYDFKAVNPYIDFVNIMTYDMGRPPYHNAPLYRSQFTNKLSVEESVDAHVKAGIPLNKLTLGMPFYGHAIKKIGDFINFNNIHTLDSLYTEKWDEKGQVPYYVDKDGKFVCSFDNAKSLELKCKFLLDKGMLGAMYWEYSCDDAEGTLRKTVYNTVMEK